MRADTYASIKAYSETDHAKTLEGEDKRFLERVLRDYERKGLHLPEETRAVIAGMWTPCSSVCVCVCRRFVSIRAVPYVFAWFAVDKM